MAAIIETHPPCGRSAPRSLHLVLEDRALVRTAVRRPTSLPWGAVARAALLALALVVVAAATVAVGRGALATAAPAPPSSGVSRAQDHVAASSGGAVIVTARPGDTIWSIARRFQPEGDVRALVDRLVAEHGSASLEPGERLMIAP